MALVASSSSRPVAIPATPKGSNYFDNADEYMSYLRDPARIIHLEWRKVRRGESKGLTSHSWLEARRLDGKRMRMEIYSDQGYSEMAHDPDGPANHRFFDRESQVYEKRIAGPQDFAQPLTASGLRQLAQRIATSRSYSLSEFNCHHFVLEVWNSVVIEVLRATHYPDRAKTSLLWGLEGTLGQWLEGIGASLAAPQDQPPAHGGGGGSGQRRAQSSSAGRAHGTVATMARNDPSYNVRHRRQSFCHELQSGCVYLLEKDGPIIPTSLPPKDTPPDGCDLWQHKCQLWADACLPDVGYPAQRIVERMNNIDLSRVVAQIFKPQPANSSGQGSALDFLNSFGSLSSLASLSPASGTVQSQPEMLQRDPLADACFVALNGREVRLAIYAVLRPPGAPDACAWRLRLISGNALDGQEGTFSYLLSDLPEGSFTTMAVELASGEMQVLQASLRSNDWTFFTEGCQWAIC